MGPLGVLVLCRPDPQPLVGHELNDALHVANLVSRLVLGLQAEATSEGVAWVPDATDSRAVVHQATGMIAAQLNVEVTEALVRLRAKAFATDRESIELPARSWLVSADSKNAEPRPQPGAGCNSVMSGSREAVGRCTHESGSTKVGPSRRVDRSNLY